MEKGAPFEQIENDPGIGVVTIEQGNYEEFQQENSQQHQGGNQPGIPQYSDQKDFGDYDVDPDDFIPDERPSK